MINIENKEVNLNCPKCKRTLKVTIKQITNQEKVTCNCGCLIQLQDKEGSNKKTANNIQKSLDDLQKTFKNFGK